MNQTLPNKLEYCVSPNQRFFNIIGMCCDVRSIYLVNSIRIGAEHGDHRPDQEELAHGNWNPADVDGDYQKVIDHRLISPHLLICGVFDQVDPETGDFSRRWEPRSFADCSTKGHDANGRLPDPVAPQAGN